MQRQGVCVRYSSYGFCRPISVSKCPPEVDQTKQLTLPVRRTVQDSFHPLKVLVMTPSVIVHIEPREQDCGTPQLKSVVNFLVIGCRLKIRPLHPKHAELESWLRAWLVVFGNDFIGNI